MTMTAAMSAALALHQPAVFQMQSTPEQDTAVRRANQLRASITSDNWPKKIKSFRDLFNLSKFDAPSIKEPISQLREMLHRGLFAEEVAETLFPGEHNKEMRSEFIHLARDKTPEQLQHYLDLNALAETIDGILDTVVVGLGWLSELGLSVERINLLMQEVHASNMTKVDNNGKPVYDSNGKVLKGDNYVKADIVGLLTAFIAADAKAAAEGAN